MKPDPVFSSDRKFALTQAILIYSDTASGQSDSVVATRHDITMDDRKPRLEEGTPVTVDGLEALARGLGRGLDAVLLPECVLSVSMGGMAWWCPAGRRRIWFKPSDKEEKDLKALNGKMVAHPPLLFTASKRSVTVHALGRNQRPDAKTPLYVAPYYNLSPEGVLCVGTMPVPEIVSPTLIPKFESAFFNSNFTHSNWGHRKTTHPKGHAGLWREMIKAKVFPTKYLVKSKSSLMHVLKLDRNS